MACMEATLSYVERETFFFFSFSLGVSIEYSMEMDGDGDEFVKGGGRFDSYTLY